MAKTVAQLEVLAKTLESMQAELQRRRAEASACQAIQPEPMTLAEMCHAAGAGLSTGQTVHDTTVEVLSPDGAAIIAQSCKVLKMQTCPCNYRIAYRAPSQHLARFKPIHGH